MRYEESAVRSRFTRVHFPRTKGSQRKPKICACGYDDKSKAHICVTNEQRDLWLEEIKRLALRLVQELDAFRNSHCITEETILTYQEFEIDALQVQVEPDVTWCAEYWYELVY